MKQGYKDVMRFLRVRVVLAVVLALAVSSGTAVLVMGQTPSGADIATKLVDNAQTITDTHATVQVSGSGAGTDGKSGSGAASFEAWSKRPGMEKVVANTVTAALPGGGMSLAVPVKGDEIVSDGQTGWLYAPGQNVAVTGTQAELKAWAEKENITPTQQSFDYAKIVQTVTQFANLTVTGSDSVGGHETWVVAVTPKSSADIVAALGTLGGGQPDAKMEQTLTQLLADNPTITLWVDKARWVLLKVSASATDKTTGANAQGAAVSADLVVNGGADSGIFAFTPPAGTRIVHAADYLPTHVSLAAAQSAATAAGWSLSTPTVTLNNAVLTEVVQVKGSYSQHYAFDDKTGYYVTEGPLPQNAAQAGLTDAEYAQLTQLLALGKTQFDAQLAAGKLNGSDHTVSKTTVRGQEAILSTSSKGTTALVWQQNGVAYVVAGNLTAEQAAQVAGSLK